jgi:hypothetical protein
VENEGEERRKGVGAAEVSAGLAAGAGAAALVPTLVGAAKYSEHNVNAAFVRAADATPMLVEIGSIIAPQVFAHITADTEIIPVVEKIGERAVAASQANFNRLVSTAHHLARGQEEFAAAGLRKPIVAFSNASRPAQIGMGAAVLASALGAAWLVNRSRDSDHSRTPG